MNRLSASLRIVLLAVVAAAVVYLGYRVLGAGSAVADPAQTYTLARRTLSDTVVERGIIESQNTVVGICELPGYENKIIWIVPEGKTVEKGELVVQLDSSNIDKMIKEQEIALNDAKGKLAQAEEDFEIQNIKGQSDIAAAELAFELAKLDRDKYLDGDYLVTKADFEQLILESQAELERLQDRLKNEKAMVSKGFRSPEQIRELELRVNQFRSRLSRDREKLNVLEKFEFTRRKTELEANARESELKLSRAKTTAAAEVRKAQSNIDNTKTAVELMQKVLDEMIESKKKCEIRAPQAGTIAYANLPWYGPEDRIREGATVRQQQNIFYLPDMTRMQVKVYVHESVVTKIKPGQTAKIRVDAFPEAQLTGQVSQVADLAQSGYSDSNTYETVVLIDSFPADLNLRPGMTAQVEILIGNYPDVFAVPHSGVTEHLGQTYVYVKSGLTPERRRVKTGRITHALVEILSGLEAGETIYLDAYQRGLRDFKATELDATLEQKAVPPDKPVPMENR